MSLYLLRYGQQPALRRGGGRAVSLRLWLSDLDAGKRPEDTAEAAELSQTEKRIAAVQKDLEDLSRQLTRIYDLTEQGVYTSDDFVTRSRENSSRRKAAEELLVSLGEQSRQLRQIIDARENLAPELRHVLDVYPTATPAEKNALLKTVLSRVIYSKTNRDRWGSGSDLHLDLIPRITFAPHR